MTMITPSYLGETIEYSSLHACRSTLEDPTAGDLAAATGCLREAVGLWPGELALQQLLADTLLQWGQPEAAAGVYHTALLLCLSNTAWFESHAYLLQQYEQLEPEARRDPAVYARLGSAFRGRGRQQDARVAYEQAIRLAPEMPGLRMNLAWVQQCICEWGGLEGVWSDLREEVRSGRDGGLTVPCFFLYVPNTAAEQLTAARSWAARHYAEYEKPSRLFRERWSAPEARTRLHIGYLSSDYRSHAVAFVIAEILELHDRASVTVSAYSLGPDDGTGMRERIVRGVDNFVDLRGMTYVNAAERILADRIDILVDLDGYSHPDSCQVQALRPAPIQASLAGFPGTSGTYFTDYVIVNPFMAPPELAPHFSERLAYLPDWDEPTETQRTVAANTPSRAACGLPEKGFVFCSFNQLYKITPAMFALWMRLLSAVPDSVLWLLNRSSEAEVNLRREASKAGIDPRRIVLDPYLPRADYLARHRLADLGLDTLPGSGGATTTDALWMGLPVVTYPGEPFQSRLTASQLHAWGVPELVTTSVAEYEATALALARDPVRLAVLRARLKANHDRVMSANGPPLVRKLERLYQRMWEEYGEGGGRGATTRTPLTI